MFSAPFLSGWVRDTLQIYILRLHCWILYVNAKLLLEILVKKTNTWPTLYRFATAHTKTINKCTYHLSKHLTHLILLNNKAWKMRGQSDVHLNKFKMREVQWILNFKKPSILWVNFFIIVCSPLNHYMPVSSQQHNLRLPDKVRVFFKVFLFNLKAEHTQSHKTKWFLLLLNKLILQVISKVKSHHKMSLYSGLLNDCRMVALCFTIINWYLT